MTDTDRLDPRIRRTRRLLQDAVLRLAEERDFAGITVSDIAREADVNRNTFYLHYRDKDHLLEQALDALFEELVTASRSFSLKTHALDSSAWIAMLIHVQAHPRLFRGLLGLGGSTAFSARLRAYQEERFLQIWTELGIQAAPGSAPPELRAKFAAGIAQAAMRWWLDEGAGTDAKTVADLSWPQIARLWSEQIEPAPGEVTA